MKRLLFAFVLLTFALVVAAPASAGPLTLNCPGGMSNQSANGALTFGGTDIPKDAVCMGVFGDVTLFLTATQRYENPVVTNNGTDTYFAGSGDDTANAQPTYTIWNFGYAAFNSGSNLAKLTVSWDTDPGVGTDVTQFGFFRQSLGANGSLQDSWNLGMGFIDTGVPSPGIYAPAAGLFNPYANGVYGFSLSVVSPSGANGTIAMEVNVSGVTASAVPEPATLSLLGLGLLGASVAARRRKSAA